MRQIADRLMVEREGLCLADTVWVADNTWARLRGLIGRPPLAAGEALWIPGCQQIHTHFMAGPLDVIFTDADLRVLCIYRALPPWRFSALVWRARSVWEFAPGGACGVMEGDRLAISPKGGVA
jgi:hypothetical protein